MYVIIGGETYDRLSNLTFDPETDVTGSTIPVNELQVDVATDDSISVGSRVSLYDDLDNLWAKYWVVYAERAEDGTVRVKGQSAVKQLERDMLDPVMYSGTTVATALQNVLARLNGEYSIDSTLAAKTLTGFCPKQTARNRFQWICLVAGAYVKDFFNDRLEVLPVDDSLDTIIPLADTYWKPKVNYNEYVTGVIVHWYSYTQQTPVTTDTWVEAGGNYYVQEEHQLSLSNPDVPAIALEHNVIIEGVTLVNQGNASAVASNLAKYHFKRTEVDLSFIDNGDYVPGQRLYFFTDRHTMYAGYLVSCAFSFGLQAMAKAKAAPVDVQESAGLTVTYMYKTLKVDEFTYTFPIGYRYSVQTQFFHIPIGTAWYVFRPVVKAVTGTMAAGGTTATVQLEVALRLADNDLETVSVDEMELSDGILEVS